MSVKRMSSQLNTCGTIGFPYGKINKIKIFCKTKKKSIKKIELQKITKDYYLIYKEPLKLINILNQMN